MVEVKMFKVLEKNLKDILKTPNSFYITEKGSFYITDKESNLIQIGCSREEFEDLKSIVQNITIEH